MKDKQNERIALLLCGGMVALILILYIYAIIVTS